MGRRRKRCVTQRAAGAGLLPFKAGGGMTRMWGSPVLRRIPDVGSAPNGMRAMEFSVRILGDESVQGRESIRRLCPGSRELRLVAWFSLLARWIPRWPYKLGLW